MTPYLKVSFGPGVSFGDDIERCPKNSIGRTIPMAEWYFFTVHYLCEGEKWVKKRFVFFLEKVDSHQEV